MLKKTARVLFLCAICALLALSAACGDDDDNAGSKGNPCYPNDTCDVGLECVAGFCIDLNDTCGDGTCAPWESAETCGADCSDTVCGDGVCEEGESITTCPDDCPDPENCGNGTIDPLELCDGAELDGETCDTQGFDGGDLACSADCTTFDTSGCNTITCGDALTEGSEVCDGSDLAGETCDSAAGLPDGQLQCAGTCDAFDVSGCHECGNGTMEGPEVCDASELGQATCADVTVFDHGELACNATCDGFDTTGCHTCGNDTIEGAEVCDGTDFAGQDCSDFGFGGGTLSCNSDCGSFDTSECLSSCDGTGDCSTCLECATTQPYCQTEHNACFSNTECVDFTDCINQCSGEPNCIDNCITTYPNGYTLYIDYVYCVVCTACYSDCDGSDPSYGC